ncbi:SdrD B-like domain-containing protein, partial [Microbacterium sp. ZW T5_56]|uniref:SdrD B-like domain-containing protein n=1 Tax=Microbacterium sp. ZW T5_56 TaxID=3378081 RepID=UPI0038525040
MKRLIAGGAVGALAATLLTVGGVSPAAVAATGDGTISVTVVRDNNVNKEHDALDVGLEGVKVHFFDIAGDEIVVDTDADGVATLAAAANTLAGGRYRVEVTNPDAGKYSEAQIADGHADPQFAPAVSFVDVRGAKDATLTVGYVDYTTLGPDGARLYSSVMGNDIWPSQNNGTEVYSTRYDMTGSPTDITTTGTIGAVYGIGIDSRSLDIYAGAYAKRGSLYGPGGSGAVYRVNSVTGAWEVYATVADAGDTEHDLGPLDPAAGFVHHDFAFREAVGREALGDVDITPDNKFLTTVNLNTEELVVYPVQADVNPAPIQTLKIAAPQSCDSDWAPMGLGQKDSSLFVGAICGSDMKTYLIEYERAADGTLSTSPVSTRQGEVALTVPRAGQNGPFGGSMAAECNPVAWRVWTDDVPQACVNGGLNGPAVGWWPQFVVPQPMFGDIEFLENGQMVLSFRDRSGDQYGLGMYVGQKDADTPSYGNIVATGDLVALPADATSLDFANPVHDFQDTGAFHAQAAYSGIAHVPGTDTVVSNTMDATGAINTNGLRAYDVETGNAVGNTFLTSAFYKGMGLADLEALVLEQTQQIGNRIWSDLDQDGIQGPNERGIAGVQVSLYDADGNVVATTETDKNGEYYFDTADGLLPDTKYEVRLDRASDFTAGGPLVGYTPTDATAGFNRDIDSNGVLNDGGVVVSAITSPKAGVNDHSIDFGFVPKLVSVGDYVWLDADADGIQDAGEKPVAGAEVILYDANGVEVARTTTDANGFYAFGDLEANAEYTIVFPTTVTVDGKQVPLTRPNQGSDDGKDSDADPKTGSVTINAPADGNNSILPGEVDDPTIDAGYATPVLVSVGDYLWIDADRDGVQDAGEKPVAGAEVVLYDAAGVEVARTTTDENGYYVFPNLSPSTDYTIGFPTTVTVGGKEYPLTKPGAGSDRGVDSNPGADGKYSFTSPAKGGNSTAPGKADDPTIDAGYVPPVLVSVGDYLWLDADRDGVQDAGEKPVAGATVVLYDAAGVEVARTTTDENGYYAFPDLTPGADYTIGFPTTVTVGGKEYPLTKPGAGSDRGSDSNPGADGEYAFTAPTKGGNSTAPGKADDPTIDAGYAPPVLV